METLYEMRLEQENAFQSFAMETVRSRFNVNNVNFWVNPNEFMKPGQALWQYHRKLRLLDFTIINLVSDLS